MIASKRADLIILDANPLDDLANTRRIRAVIDGGHYLSRAAPDQRLHDLEIRYEGMRNQGGNSVNPSGCR